METKLTSKDYRLIAFCIVLSLICIFVTTKYFYKAFPEASLDFKVTRGESKEIAQRFLGSLDLAPGDDKHACIFSFDNEAKVFLERELGLEEANKIMGSKVKLWRWSNRWYQPLQKEEMTVRVSPEGEVIGFNHLVPEEQEGPSLTADSARVLAMSFLSETIKLNPESLEFVEESSNERPKRLDHTFVWKEKDFDVHNSSYRHKVTVQGDKVGGYSQYLHVPEEWSRGYEKLRAKNETTASVSFLFLFLTIFGMLCIMVVYTRHRDIRWKTALVFGAIATVLSFLSDMNSFPLTLYNYPTTETYSSFLIRNIMMSLLNSVLGGAGIFLITASAEVLYRERYKDKISLSNLFRWRGIRTKKTFIALIVGFTLTFFFVGYVVIFYMLASKIGGWVPQDIPYTNLLNTAFPWVFILLFGFWPAVSEEFISRMFSIPFLEKFIKTRWLAVVIPAFIWGFAHANYPQQPFYIRGVEVGIMGIIVGYMMLRFGILATLAWHYTIDAAFTALLFFRSGNPYFMVTAAISCGILALPLIIALVAYLKTRSFASADSITNQAEGVSRISQKEPEAATAIRLSYTALSKRRIAIGFAVSLLLLGAFLLPAKKFGEFVKFRHSASEAEKTAQTFLTHQEFDVGDFKSVTFAQSRFDPYVAKYVLENDDIERLNQLYSDERVGVCWVTRYYKPLQKEEYQVYVDPRNLDVVAFLRLMEEDAPGDSISKDSALAVASTFAMARGLDISNMKLQEATSEKRPNRLDHVFVWEANEGDARNVGEMKYRVSVEMQGNIISKLSTFPKLPETWERQRKKRTWVNSLHLALFILVIAGFVVLGVVRFIRQARSGAIRWKKVLIIAGIGVAISILGFVNDLPTAMRNYQTSIEYNLFLISMLVGVLILFLALFIGLGLSVGLATALYPDSIDCLKSTSRRIFGRDAIILSIIAVLGLLGLERFGVVLTSRFSTAALIGGLTLPSSVDSLLPGVGIIAASLIKSILIATIGGVVLFVLTGIVRKRTISILILTLVLIAFAPLSVRSWSELLLSIASIFPVLVWVLVLLKYYFRDNYLAYLAVPFFYSLASSVISLTGQDSSFLTLNAAAVGVLLIAVVAWIFWPVRKRTI